MAAAATVIAVVIATVVDVDVAGIVTGIVAVVATGNASRASHESSALPENYTPIVLPGESISKYRGVEPVTVQEPTEATASGRAGYRIGNRFGRSHGKRCSGRAGCS